MNLFGFRYTRVAVPIGPAVVTTLPGAAGNSTLSLAASKGETGAVGRVGVESLPSKGS